MSDTESFDDLQAEPTMRRPSEKPSPPEGAAFDSIDFEQTIPRTLAGTSVFGRYTLCRELGRGGMGIVWLARDETLETDVALKFLPDSVARDSEAVADLKRETLRSRELRSPGIVAVYEFVQDAQSAAIVMEYVDGPTLSELKVEQPGGCFEAEEIRPWIETLCEVLAYAHTHARIAHRDLKPRNLMITSSGRLKVADFGIARSVSDSMSRVSMRANNSGTPPYMSPQQDYGETPSTSDDIYAMGATIYDLLTSKPPFYTGNISRQIHEKIAPSMAERRVALGVEGKAPISDEWEQLVAACLAKTPEERPQSTTECLAWLRGEVRTAPPIASASMPPPAPRPRRWAAVVAPLATALMLMAGWVVWQNTRPKPASVPESPTVPAIAPAAPVAEVRPVSTPEPAPPVAVTPPAAPEVAAPPTPTPAPAPVASTIPPEAPQSTPAPAIATPLPEPPAPVANATPAPTPKVAVAAATKPKPATTEKQRPRTKSASDNTAERSSAPPPSHSNDPVRQGIETQYRRGQITREQYLNAIRSL